MYQQQQNQSHHSQAAPPNNMNTSQNLNGTMGSQQSNNNTANLKGKLQALEEMILQLADELQYHKKEVQVLRSEKETLESVLTMKT